MIIIPGARGMVDFLQKFETGDECERIDSYQLNAVTKKEETWYPVEKKVKEKIEYDETVQDHSPIEWTNKEYEIKMQDVEIEVDDWELVLVEEQHNEKPYVVPGKHEDITYLSESAICENMEPFEIEEQVYTCTEIQKKVKLNIKVERMQTREYALATLKKL